MNEGLQVIMTSAFYRDGEPGGIAAGMKFAPEEGVKFCNELEESLLEYDKFTFVQLQSELARLAPRRHDLRPSEACHVIACIYCMQVRNDIRSDEYNGTIFACVLGKTLINCERNPVTLDLTKEMTSKSAVDITVIVKASHLPLDDGATAAIRTVVDHARRQR